MLWIDIDSASTQLIFLWRETIFAQDLKDNSTHWVSI